MVYIIETLGIQKCTNMANIKSANKIKEYVKSQNRVVTPSKICLELHLKWKTVRECLDFLKETNQIRLFSNGKTSFVLINQEVIKNDYVFVK